MCFSLGIGAMEESVGDNWGPPRVPPGQTPPSTASVDDAITSPARSHSPSPRDLLCVAQSLRVDLNMSCGREDFMATSHPAEPVPYNRGAPNGVMDAGGDLAALGNEGGAMELMLGDDPAAYETTYGGLTWAQVLPVW